MRKARVYSNSFGAACLCCALFANVGSAQSQASYQYTPEVPIGFNQACANSYLVNKLKNGYLNIRSGPGTNYGVTGRLRNGQEINIADCRGNWLGIRDPRSNEQIGWVHKTYLTGARWN